jgi:hypothetical protein
MCSRFWGGNGIAWNGRTGNENGKTGNGRLPLTFFIVVEMLNSKQDNLIGFICFSCVGINHQKGGD